MPSRRQLVRAAFWGSVLAGSVALIFEWSQGFVASAFFVAFALLVLLRYRGTLDAALPVAAVLAGLGLALGAIPFEPIRDAADGAVACAIIIVLAILYRDAAARRRAPALSRAGLRLRAAALGTRAELSLRALLHRLDDVTWHRFWIGFAAIAVLAGIVVAAGASRSQEGWRLVGGPDGAAVWNASFLEAPLQREGPHLRDPAIVTADGSPPRVGIADSPLLTAAKLAVPAPWTGPEIANLLAILNLTALLLCAVLFVAALVLGLLDVAGGYELAVLALGLGLAGRLPPRFAWALGIVGVLGSLVGALVSGALSPDTTTLSLWWSSNALVRLARASGVAWSWALVALALAVIVAGWFWSLKKHDRGTRDAGVAAIVAGVLAIPALLGGVPLLVPARLLDVVPLGWPTARILALATLLLVVPVAVALRLVIGRADGMRAPLRAIAFVALVVAGLAVVRPATPSVILPWVPARSDVVELPLAESGSRASFVFADDLLERGARISQPVPYISVPTLLSGEGSADLAIEMLRKRPPPAFVAVRLDVYAEPALRFAQPTVIDAADYAVPILSDDPRAVLSSLTDQARVYQLVP
jgi:hypothetical protein